MSRKFKCTIVPSKWLNDNGRRLDCGPYVSGAVEARVLLASLKEKKDCLSSLTQNGIDGIINAGRISRVWVDDTKYGIPFLSSTEILQADLDSVGLISKSVISQNEKLTIKKNWSLITRSGTVGRMSFSREDMDGMACSEHVLRVVPDENKVPAGYLYAYLSSKFGVPLIVSGTYGAIIQHIEPEHIADLPVPRLGAVEEQVHDLVQRAADLRTEANALLKDVTYDLELEIGNGSVKWDYSHVQSFSTGVKQISSCWNRLDAFHYIGYVGEALEKAKVPLTEVSKYARALRPPIMKRNRVEEGGYEFLGGSELVMLNQRGETRISAKTPSIGKYIVHPGYVLFQCVGQRYGLFGRPVLANRLLVGKTVTEAVMRLIPHDKRDAGYLSVYLATGFGQRLVMQYSAGTSIPVLQESGAEKILVYWPDDNRRLEISKIAEQAWENRALATELEDRARVLVEEAIEQGGR